jgi:hypothetical protein
VCPKDQDLQIIMLKGTNKVSVLSSFKYTITATTKQNKSQQMHDKEQLDNINM